MFVFWILASLTTHQIHGFRIGRTTDLHQPESIKRSSPNAVVGSIERLGIDLSLQESIKRGSEGNVVLSPLSISSLLGVLLLASSNNTHRELKQAMQLGALNDGEIHESYRRILGTLDSDHKRVLLEIASRLYIQSGLSLEYEFIKNAESMYNFTVGSVDFIHDSLEAKQQINQWVSNRTHGGIDNFIRQGFHPDTRLVALNAVYFNGDWETPFNPVLTEPNGVFNVDNVRKIRIPFMRNLVKLKYTTSDQFTDHSCDIGGFDMIALPYKGNQYSMYMIRPKGTPSAIRLPQIERKLKNDCINSIISSMTDERVSIHIPRMELSSRISLKQSLQNLNVHSLFDPTKVDLSSLSSSPGLNVDQIQHEAFIKINELGTEAAAVTGVTVDRIGGSLQFRLDVPSIIFIRNNFNGILLFWAKVVEPEALH